MVTLAANLELLFTEHGSDIGARARAAAEFGFTEVEIWTWRDKDLDSLERALADTGTTLRTLIVDPQLPLTNPAVHEDFLRATRESVTVAQRLGSPNLVVVAGADLSPGDPHARAAGRAALVSALARATELMPADVRLLLEPLNDRVDHPGTFLTSTGEGLDIVQEVGSDRLRLLLDAYHALMMDENLTEVIAGRIGLVEHVQLADIPGRHEPGTGKLDWNGLFAELSSLGYRGSYGLEYLPATETTATLARIWQLAAAAR